MIVEPRYQIYTPVTSAARTADGNSDSHNVVLARTLQVFLDITVVSGTSPTLDIKLQTSPDETLWVDYPGAVFTTKTATGSDVIHLTNVPAAYYRISWTIAGTTPSFTFSMQAVIKG